MAISEWDGNTRFLDPEPNALAMTKVMTNGHMEISPLVNPGS